MRPHPDIEAWLARILNEVGQVRAAKISGLGRATINRWLAGAQLRKGSIALLVLAKARYEKQREQAGPVPSETPEHVVSLN